MVSKLCLPISSALMLSGAGGMVSLTEAAAVSGSFLKVAPIDRCEALTSEASAALDRAVAQCSRPKAAGPARDAQGGEKATQPSWASRCSSSASYPSGPIRAAELRDRERDRAQRHHSLASAGGVSADTAGGSGVPACLGAEEEDPVGASMAATCFSACTTAPHRLIFPRVARYGMPGRRCLRMLRGYRDELCRGWPAVLPATPAARGLGL
jgi:hypothetical protein